MNNLHNCLASSHFTFWMATPAQVASYNAQVEQRFAHVKSILNDAGWKQSEKQADIVFYNRQEAGSSFTQVKSVVTIAKPPAAVIAYVKSDRPITASTPKDQREGCHERRIVSKVEGDPNQAAFYYIAVDTNSAVVSSRDFLMFERVFVEGPVQYLVRTSIVNDAIVPPKKDLVRANMIFQAFVVEPAPGGSKLTFLVHADPAGSIPAVIYNTAVNGQGLSALRAKKALEK
jgi:hypothetical protein